MRVNIALVAWNMYVVTMGMQEMTSDWPVETKIKGSPGENGSSWARYPSRVNVVHMANWGSQINWSGYYGTDVTELYCWLSKNKINPYPTVRRGR